MTNPTLDEQVASPHEVLRLHRDRELVSIKEKQPNITKYHFFYIKTEIGIATDESILAEFDKLKAELKLKTTALNDVAHDLFKIIQTSP